MTRKSVHSIDVARLAGVSRSAVSRAFTDGASISESKRLRIFEAAKQLGYRPNAIARSLITSRSNLIGLLLADLKNPFYSNVLDLLCQKIQRSGRGTLLFSCEYADPETMLSNLLSYQVDAVLMTAATLSAGLVEQCERFGKPLVVINKYTESAGISCVSCDNVASGQLVAGHLVARDSRRIGYIAGSQSTLSSRDRERGFIDGLRERGRDLYARDVGYYTYQGGIEAARRVLSLLPRPDAIFCANDAMACAVIDVARSEFGIRVPDDLGVVGFDNNPSSAANAYDLTTVDQNIDDLTTAAMNILLSELEAPSKGARQVVVPGRLVIRSSSRR
jgi:DNA-binding LacI/PurR family transcriptional regulator